MTQSFDEKVEFFRHEAAGLLLLLFYSWESIISYLQKIWTENYQNQWNFFAWNWNWSHCINWWATCLSNGHDPNFLSPRSSQIILFFFIFFTFYLFSFIFELNGPLIYIFHLKLDKTFILFFFLRNWYDSCFHLLRTFYFR